MNKVWQTKVVVRNSDDDIVVNGNCYAAAIASMMELPIEQVPNVEVLFNMSDKDKFFWDDVMNKWLNNRNYNIQDASEFRIFHPEIFEPEFKEHGLTFNIAEERKKLKDQFYFCEGPSKRGVFHICIYQNGQLVHDPHPTNEGLVTVNYFKKLVKK